jgi:hypothetical protein
MAMRLSRTQHTLQHQRAGTAPGQLAQLAQPRPPESRVVEHQQPGLSQLLKMGV